MPRYYFHTHAPEGVIQDGEGQELADMDAVQTEALASVREMVGESIKAGTGTKREYELHVTDGAGDIVHKLPFSNVLRD